MDLQTIFLLCQLWGPLPAHIECHPNVAYVHEEDCLFDAGKLSAGLAARREDMRWICMDIKLREDRRDSSWWEPFQKEDE